MINYNTKKGRTTGTLLFFATAIVYLAMSAVLIRGLDLRDAGWLRFMLTLVHEAILITGGIKLFKHAEQTSGKTIGVVMILLAVTEFIISIPVNLGQYF